MATVTVEFDDAIQANALAILAEEGRLAEFINDRLEDIGLSEHKIETDPFMTFDDSDHYPDHRADYTE